GGVRWARLHRQRPDHRRRRVARVEAGDPRADFRSRAPYRPVRAAPGSAAEPGHRGRLPLRRPPASRRRAGRRRRDRAAGRNLRRDSPDRADARRRVRVARAARGRHNRKGDVVTRMLALAWKELLQIRRDSMTMRMIVGVPIMQLIIFGYAINYDVKHMKAVVMDDSRSYESRELVAKMEATGYFDIIGRV